MNTLVAQPRTRVVILGAAGRDFHNFNMAYRDDPAIEVVAFTGAQIEGIADRRYPRELAGALYPDGIPIVQESCLEDLHMRHPFDRVVFAYSDVTHEHVMHLASRAVAAGADGILIEVHSNPECALCDGEESIKPSKFKELMQDMRKIATAVGREL